MTFLEIRQRIAEMLGLSSADTVADDNATLENKFKEWVNARYRVLCGKRQWNWLLKNTILQTSTQITTGTVSISDTSANITFSSGPAVSVAGWFIKFAGSEDWYEISTHTAAATAAVLTVPFIGTTAPTSTYTLRKVYYVLPTDCHQVFDVFETVNDKKLKYLPMRYLDHVVPERTTVSVPDFYTILGVDSSKQARVEFYPVPDQRMNLWVRYYQTAAEMSSDSDTPLIPIAFHDVLVWDVLATYGFLFLDDSRVNEAKKIAEKIYEDMVKNDIDAENVVSRLPYDAGSLTSKDEWLKRLDLPISE